LSYVSYQQTLLKELILYRKTAHSLSNAVLSQSSKTAKIKMFINYKRKTNALAYTFKACG